MFNYVHRKFIVVDIENCLMYWNKMVQADGVKRYTLKNGTERVRIPIGLPLSHADGLNDDDSAEQYLLATLHGVRQHYVRSGWILRGGGQWNRHLFFPEYPADGKRFVIAGPLYPESSRVKIYGVIQNGKLVADIDVPAQQSEQSSYVLSLLLERLYMQMEEGSLERDLNP